MPIYAYKCTNCGFEKDYLQKMSDKPITKCPKCGQDEERAFSAWIRIEGYWLGGHRF